MDTATLEIHICDQRRSYLATFATEDQALAFIEARWTTHATSELEEKPIPQSWVRLIDKLYPTCPHGLSESNCYGPQHYYYDGPQHYYYDEEEQARGMRNGW